MNNVMQMTLNVNKMLYLEPVPDRIRLKTHWVRSTTLEGRAVVQTSAQGRAVYDVQELRIQTFFFYPGSGAHFLSKF